MPTQPARHEICRSYLSNYPRRHRLERLPSNSPTGAVVADHVVGGLVPDGVGLEVVEVPDAVLCRRATVGEQTRHRESERIACIVRSNREIGFP